jgi:hypothetical protein
MTELTQREPANPSVPLYSHKAIAIGTFFGGLLAAGVMTRRNFLNLGRVGPARLALVLSVVVSALVFGVLFALPEAVSNSIPNSLLPVLFAAVVYHLVEKFLGTELRAHQNSEGPFYSGWRTLGVCLSTLFGTLAVLAVCLVTFLPTFDVDQYNQGLAEIRQNEDIALGLYPLMDTEDHDGVVQFIDETGLPAWEASLKLLEKMDQLKEIDAESLAQNQRLRAYIEARIETYGLMRKTIVEHTEEHLPRMNELGEKIKNMEI